MVAFQCMGYGALFDMAMVILLGLSHIQEDVKTKYIPLSNTYHPKTVLLQVGLTNHSHTTVSQ